MTSIFDYEGDLIVLTYLSEAQGFCECVRVDENGPERKENSDLFRCNYYLKNFPYIMYHKL